MIAGAYGFSGSSDGTYQLEFEGRGFSKLVMNNAQIRGGLGSQNKTRHFKLGATHTSHDNGDSLAAPSVETTIRHIG